MSWKSTRSHLLATGTHVAQRFELRAPKNLGWIRMIESLHRASRLDPSRVIVGVFGSLYQHATSGLRLVSGGRADSRMAKARKALRPDTFSLRKMDAN